jgi:hypothetical protein
LPLSHSSSPATLVAVAIARLIVVSIVTVASWIEVVVIIASPPSRTYYRIAPTLAVECSTSYTAAASAVAAAAVHILPTIGRMTMRAAGGAAPAAVFWVF